LPCSWIQREVDLRGLAPILVSKPGSWFLHYSVSRSMSVTRSGTLYAMATNQNPNNLNPNDQNPNTQDTDQPQLQHHTDQITTVLEQLTHQLDVMDDRYVREENGPFNRRGRRAVCGEGLDKSDGDAYEEEEFPRSLRIMSLESDVIGKTFTKVMRVMAHVINILMN